MLSPHIRDYTGKRVHMIGIGGSSMSGLAEMLQQKGYAVTGSDGTESYATKKLRALGIPVEIGHRPQNVRGADLVVYTAAIASDNPERLEIARLGIPSMERAALLGQLMEGYPRAVGVCGTHGKTTTTSMLSQIAVSAGLDPSVHIGGQLDAIGGSTRIGGGDAFVAEACEFNASFLHLRPTIAVVLNVEEDHLDFYRDIDDITQTFGKFLALLPSDGLCIGNGDDPRVASLMEGLSCAHESFGLNDRCDWHPERLVEDDTGRAGFDLAYRGEVRTHVQLRVPGRFNVLNALAAMAAAHALGASFEDLKRGMEAFTGAHRRFEHTSTVQGVRLYHDYGHNPTEMRNALSIAKMQHPGRLWAVMQPHTYSRVKHLFDSYIDCCRDADEILITDIFAAREKDPGDIHASMLVEAIEKTGQRVHYTPTFDDAEAYLRAHWQPGDLVLTMGCGNINLLNDQIAQHGPQD